MEDTKLNSIEGRLKKITHEYRSNKFQNSHIKIRDRKDDRIKAGTFHGKIPESLLGKRVKFEQSYKKATGELNQILTYGKRNLKYQIRSYVSNVAENEDFE